MENAPLPKAIETKRLILRMADPAFAGALAAYYARNRVFFEPFDPLRQDAFFTERVQRDTLLLEQAQQKRGESYRLYVFRRESPAAIIGLVGLNNIVMGSFRSCFLSYKLDAAHLRQGYMSEAVEAAVQFAFGTLGLHRIEGNVMPKNKASLGVLEKCGFESEGVSPKYLRINGKWEDHIHMVRRNLEME